MRSACSWCRSTRFYITCGPADVLLECAICHAKTTKNHKGWRLDDTPRPPIAWPRSADTQGVETLGGVRHVTQDVVQAAQERTDFVSVEIVLIE